jgi:hypothetical protein
MIERIEKTRIPVEIHHADLNVLFVAFALIRQEFIGTILLELLCCTEVLPATQLDYL